MSWHSHENHFFLLPIKNEIIFIHYSKNLMKKQFQLFRQVSPLAEKEGLEPSRRLPDLRP